MKISKVLLYLLGFGCFLHVLLVRPPQVVLLPSSSSSDDGISGQDLKEAYHKQAILLRNGNVGASSSNWQLKTLEGGITDMDAAFSMDTLTDDDNVDHHDEPKVPTNLPPLSIQTAKTTNSTTTTRASCPATSLIPKKSRYRIEFEKSFPVQVPYTPVDDWDAISCAKIPKSCNLTDHDQWGHPFLMISFGRSGTTSTWDIVAGLTGEYIPHASEDEGRDKGEGRAFFEAQSQNGEHGKCWLQRLLCEKQRVVKKAYKDGLGKASLYGTKWKPWHQGLNSTQAREALQWVGTQKYIKVLYNTRNMVDMYISKQKHQVLHDLFGDERTAHCVDERPMHLSETAWQKLVAMGIPRQTPCVQIFKEIEARMALSVPHMLDYFEKNVLQTDFAAEMLDYYNVSRVTVTYEKLYFTQHAEEWMRIFRYLGFGPQHNLTLDQVFAKTAFQKTSSNDRSKRMSNYNEVVNALQCTRYAEYLD